MGNHLTKEQVFTDTCVLHIYSNTFGKKYGRLD